MDEKEKRVHRENAILRKELGPSDHPMCRCQILVKRRSPVQEKLARIKDIVLKDALSGEKSIIELAKIYGTNPVSLLKFHKENGIKKKRKYVDYKSGYNRGCYKNQIEELRDYIRKNNITKEEIISTIVSIFK